jgi:hypothetical protein
MTTLNLQSIRDELCIFLRSSDVITTAIRGVTRTAGTYTVGVGGEATHTFAGMTPIRDFKSLTVNAAAKKYLTDYTVNWTTGVLTWNSALIENDVVVYSVDWGTGDKIYPDMPRDDLNLASFPRIGIEVVNVSTQPVGLGGLNHLSDILISVIVWAPANKDSSVASGFGGMADLEATIILIRDAIRSSAKTFYNFSWITPTAIGPVTKGRDEKIMQQSHDFMIRFKFE